MTGCVKRHFLLLPKKILRCTDFTFVVVFVVLVSFLLPFIHKIIETNQINTSATTVYIVCLPENDGKRNRIKVKEEKLLKSIKGVNNDRTQYETSKEKREREKNINRTLIQLNRLLSTYGISSLAYLL